MHVYSFCQDFSNCKILYDNVTLAEGIINYCSFHISLLNTFWWSLFYSLIILIWNFHAACKRFWCSQKRNFSWIRQKKKKIPIEKSLTLLWQRHVYRHDVAKVGDFYNRGLWGNSLSFVVSNWNIGSGYIKNVDAYHVSFS